MLYGIGHQRSFNAFHHECLGGFTGDQFLDQVVSRFSNENLSADGIRFYTRRIIHGRAHNRIFHPHFGTDIADHHTAGVDTDAHFKGRVALTNKCVVEIVQCMLHGNGTGNRALGICFVFFRNTENNKDRIADDLIDDAVVIYYYLGHLLKIPVQKLNHYFRIQGLRQAGETANVRH